MSFLAPLYLLLGGAIAVPLLIHLLRRRIGRRLEFPAARYLARAEREHSRTLRLRNLLLMMLRVLIVLLVALAAARPMARWVGSGHAPTALAIVVDNSLSSGAIVDGRPVLDQLKVRAREALDLGASADRLTLVTADGAVRGGTAATLRAELDHLEPLGGAGDLPGALARAGRAVRAAGLDARQIAILTDGQRTSWSRDYDLGETDVLVWLPPGHPPPNRAVVLAEARPPRWTPRGALGARLMSRDSTTYRITLAGRSLARGTAAPNEEITIHAAPPERGWLAGTVEIEPDELPADNVRHFAVWIGPAPSVALAPSVGPFVRSAFDVLRANQRIVDGRDIAVLPADELTSLPALIIAPSDPVRIGAANRALERAGVPWRFGAAKRGGQGGEQVVRGPRVGDATAAMRYDLVAQAGAIADTLAVAGRDPWIVAGPRYVIVASPLLADATNFPVRATFVPWMAEMLTERLVGEPGQILEAAPMASLARPSWAEAMEMPSGAHAVLGETYAAPAQAGTYFLDRGGRRVGALVVNPEPQESVLDRWSAPEMAKRFRARRVSVAPTSAVWQSLSFRSASRRPLLAPVLFAALVLLAAEAAMVRPSMKRIA